MRALREFSRKEVGKLNACRSNPARQLYLKKKKKKALLEHRHSTPLIMFFDCFHSTMVDVLGTIWTSKPKTVTTGTFANNFANSRSRERGNKGFGDGVWPSQVRKHVQRWQSNKNNAYF